MHGIIIQNYDDKYFLKLCGELNTRVVAGFVFSGKFTTKKSLSICQWLEEDLYINIPHFTK